MFTKTVRRMCRNIALHLAVLTNERENRPWNFVQVCSKMGFGKRVRDLNSAPRLPVYQSSLLSEDLHIYWTTQSFYRPRRSLFTWLLYFSCAMLCANKYRSWQTSGRFDIDRIRWTRSLSLSLRIYMATIHLGPYNYRVHPNIPPRSVVPLLSESVKKWYGRTGDKINYILKSVDDLYFTQELTTCGQRKTYLKDSISLPTTSTQATSCMNAKVAEDGVKNTHCI